ncbi:hypothetical protein HGRIS_009789 [Hohenbuehelia grisea]|uniref:Cytochrome P450 n=1 Tax=Hohenbuehelia grisea TaxID=104357 RepID=A0ABR3J2T3_9AGAR
MENNVLYAIVSVVASWVLVNKWLDYTTPDLSFIPALGSTNRLASFKGAIRFAREAPQVLVEGVSKFKGAIFRVPLISRWVVVVSDPKMIDDIRNARPRDVSFSDAINEVIQTKYTLGPEMAVEANTYHIRVIRGPLTRSLGARFGDIYDEIATAFSDYVPLKHDEWVAVPTLDAVMKVVCRTTNRLFVDVPVCRDEDYIELNTRFTMDVFIAGMLINLFPKFLHPIVGPLFSPASRGYKRAFKHLGPLVEQRMRDDEEYGADRADRPIDLISLLMDNAPEEERTLRLYIMRVLLVNFAAIHTTSYNFTHALFYLAAKPEYVQPLREEVENIIAEEGWTKTAVEKMRKVDSFIREASRIIGIGAFSMDRTVVNPNGFTFSNGTKLPQGAVMAVASYAIHHDEDKYAGPEEFDGFRFSKTDDDESVKHQLVNTETDFLVFGHGLHACPGRFFASVEMKTMLAYVLLDYDIKIEGDGGLPASSWFGTASMPNPKARVMFRKRQ